MAIEKWEIDPVHSSVGFTVRHMVVAKVHGQFTKWTGNLQLDMNDLTASKVDVTIEAPSISTGEPQRDGHLRSPDFLDVEKFPRIEFQSSRIEKAGPETFRMAGDLVIRGVKRQVVLETDFGGRAKDPWGGDRVGFTAKTKFSRKDFGLEWNTTLETGGVLVGDTVEVTIEIEAKKAT
jgi:polyisoprenoid-binding protein YceI